MVRCSCFNYNIIMVCNNNRATLITQPYFELLKNIENTFLLASSPHLIFLLYLSDKIILLSLLANTRQSPVDINVVTVVKRAQGFSHYSSASGLSNNTMVPPFSRFLTISLSTVVFLIIPPLIICQESSSSSSTVQVTIEQGQLAGTTLSSRNGNEFYAFHSIPYAKPPVGSLRFQVRYPKNRQFCRYKTELYIYLSSLLISFVIYRLQ